MTINELWERWVEIWENNEDNNNTSDLYEVFENSFWEAYELGCNLKNE